jgi:hypothetical protein
VIRRNGGYGRNEYRLGDYGLDAKTARQRFREYMACFGIEYVFMPELPPGSLPSTQFATSFADPDE